MLPRDRSGTLAAWVGDRWRYKKRSDPPKAVECDFSGTLLAGAAVGPPWEDRYRNLWFPVIGTRGDSRVFVKWLSGFRIKIVSGPREVERVAGIEAEPILPALTRDDLRLFCRYDGGPPYR